MPDQELQYLLKHKKLAEEKKANMAAANSGSVGRGKSFVPVVRKNVA